MGQFSKVLIAIDDAGLWYQPSHSLSLEVSLHKLLSRGVIDTHQVDHST